LHPDRILIGSLPTPSGLAAAAALRNVYASWVEPAKIVTVNLWSSELAKLVANAMLAQRISSINTISAICERTGADVEELAHTIGLDQRIGSKFLKAGIGFGGSCFKKDILSLIYLANSLELPEVGEYWMQVLKINEMQRVRFVRRIVQKLNGNLQGKKITILGYAFKKDTNDTRESPAIDVIKQLLADAPAEIAIFDPQCTPSLVETEVKQFFSGTYPKLLKTDGGPIAAYADAYNACHDSSAVIILTEWDQFRYPPLPVPNSAFHEGDVLRRNEQVKIKGHARNPNETLVLEIRERKQSISTPLSKSAGFFDPLARFENEPPCPGDCAQCLRSQSEDVIAHQTVDWIRIGYHMRKPRWVFDGRGVLDVHGMEKLGFRVESIGKAGTASKLNGMHASPGIWNETDNIRGQISSIFSLIWW
jgi:UDPglucose 6-dehydrogenase